MGPTQFGTQCVLNWKCEIEPAHIAQIAYIEPFSKLHRQPLRNVFQHLLAVGGPVVLPAGLENRLADLPVGRHHGGVDRRVDLPLRLDHIAPNRAVGILRLRAVQEVFPFRQFIHQIVLSRRSDSKQIAVRSSAGQRQHQHIVLNTVDQEPVRENVAFPMPSPVPRQAVVFVLLRQQFTHGKRGDHVLQKFHIHAAFQGQLIVLLKLRGRFDDILCLPHAFKSANNSSRSL